jgi:hypothetical protein
MALALPNVNELLMGLGGRLFPLGWARLLWRLKRCKPRSARLILLGVKKKFRGDVLGGLAVLLYAEMHERGRKRGFTRGELSWTLEDNVKINHGIALMGGTVYKRYRLYEKRIS